MKKRLEFRCPECGSKQYATVAPANEGRCTGGLVHASSGRSSPCMFRWSRAEDWRYFSLVIAAESLADLRVLSAIGQSLRAPRVSVHNAGVNVSLGAPTLPPSSDGTYVYEDEHRARLAERESATLLPPGEDSEPTLPSQKAPFAGSYGGAGLPASSHVDRLASPSEIEDDELT